MIKLQATGEEGIEVLRKEYNDEKIILVQEQQRLKDEAQMHKWDIFFSSFTAFALLIFVNK